MCTYIRKKKKDDRLSLLEPRTDCEDCGRLRRLRKTAKTAEDCAEASTVDDSDAIAPPAIPALETEELVSPRRHKVDSATAAASP